MDTLTCEYGRAVSYTVTLRDGNGSPLTTTYAGTEAIAAKVWAGDDRASLVTPTVAWLSAADATLALSMTAAQTDDLTPGTYVMSVDITDGGEVYECFRSWLRVEAVAGIATAGTAYCMLDDMLEAAGDLVEDLQNRADVAGFAEQREEAARWTRKTIRTRAEVIGRRHLEQHSPVVTQTAIEISDGLDDGPEWGPSIYPDTTLRTHLDLVTSWVDSGYLMQTEDDDEALRRANALYSVGLVYRRQHGESAKGETYRMMAARMFSEAIRLLASYTFRFDLDNDGTVDRELEPV